MLYFASGLHGLLLMWMANCIAHVLLQPCRTWPAALCMRTIIIVHCLGGSAVYMFHYNGVAECARVLCIMSALRGELHLTRSITLVQFMAGWTAHELLVMQCMGSWIAYMYHYDSIVLY